jgi:hypothetical protein
MRLRAVLKRADRAGERTLPIEDKPDWVARARELAPMVEAAAGRTEAERKIPADVLAAMHDAGLFHILLPVSLGGAAADLVTFNHVMGHDSPRHTQTFFAWQQSKKPLSLLTLSRLVCECLGHTRTRPASPVLPVFVTPVTPERSPDVCKSDHRDGHQRR